MANQITIRTIKPSDNVAIAHIIRTCLEEFGANKPGTVYFDDTTDHLYELFQSAQGSIYLIAENMGAVVGGCGIFPTIGLPHYTCELVKLYILPEARGIGLGKKLMAECFEWAKNSGYKQIYLETMPELAKAVSVYEKSGFSYLKAPMGNSGHCGCDIWMLKVL